MADNRHLKKTKDRNISTMDGPISTKFGTVMFPGHPDPSANKILLF